MTKCRIYFIRIRNFWRWGTILGWPKSSLSPSSTVILIESTKNTYWFSFWNISGFNFVGLFPQVIIDSFLTIFVFHIRKRIEVFQAFPKFWTRFETIWLVLILLDFRNNIRNFSSFGEIYQTRFAQEIFHTLLYKQNFALILAIIGDAWGIYRPVIEKILITECFIILIKIALWILNKGALPDA